MTKKVLLIFGTRPEAIKMASVYHALAVDEHIDVQVCVTAQHRDMLDSMLTLFDITPNYDLNIMQENQTLFDVTANILTLLQPVFAKSQPDMVLVHGDTTTSFVAALASFYLKVPCAHVEAGLRTGDLSAPFPEEANRSLTARLASLHFAPTVTARNNLLAEGIAKEKIVVTGNSVVDALFWVQKKLAWQASWEALYGSAVDVVKHQKPFILATGHRRENFGQGFKNICQALREIALTHPDWHIVYPVHLNPAVQQPVFDLLSDVDNIHLIKPLDYAPFIYLMMQSKIVLTDSGGIQEEAPSLGKPVLVMREKTERPEAVAAGTVRLVGTDAQKILQNVTALIKDKVLYQRMSEAINPYGDGHAAEKIVNALKNYWKDDEKK